jgi:8-oxo-dGTP diphosphatase
MKQEYLSKSAMQVACAIIEYNGKILAVQRGERQSLPLKWEFPGGKIHQGESPEACVVREVSEELNMQIAVIRPLSLVNYDYPDFSVTLHPFICTIVSGNIILRDHKAMLWLLPHELQTLDLVTADFPIIKEYLEGLSKDPS